MTMYVLEYVGWFFTSFNNNGIPVCVEDAYDEKVARFRYITDAMLYIERFDTLKKFTVVQYKF